MKCDICNEEREYSHFWDIDWNRRIKHAGFFIDVCSECRGIDLDCPKKDLSPEQMSKMERNASFKSLFSFDNIKLSLFAIGIPPILFLVFLMIAGTFDLRYGGSDIGTFVAIGASLLFFVFMPNRLIGKYVSNELVTFKMFGIML